MARKIIFESLNFSKIDHWSVTDIERQTVRVNIPTFLVLNLKENEIRKEINCNFCIFLLTHRGNTFLAKVLTKHLFRSIVTILYVFSFYPPKIPHSDCHGDIKIFFSP